MLNPMEEIQALQREAKRAETELTTAQADMNNLQRQADEIKTELAGMGLTPETLDAEITKRQQERDSKVAEARKLLHPEA